ncbi:MAG TPA: cytochrome c peroxidase [Gemmataceae bacterium]|nr:cytochrome c peroxidase [Gemmataceae bacterium]
MFLGAIGLTVAWTASGRAAPPADIAEVPDVAVEAPVYKLNLPDTPYRYANIDLPAHFKTSNARALDNTPANNQLTDDGATLGRVIFYDKRVSSSNTTACASCHHQKNAFTDPERFSKGHEGKRVDRHAMALGDLRYYSRGRFFWDERAPTLEAQVLMPMQSKVEMGADLNKLVTLMSKDAKYPELFSKAFGTKEVNKDRISKALAQFIRSMVSYQSKYDEGLIKANGVRNNFPNFTAQENAGKTLFLQRCANCHMTGGQSAHFFMNQTLNNGLDNDTRKTDGGVGDITLRGNDVGKFKSPSLRNVEFTAPYMHDGRFDTLEKVIEHYSSGVKQHPNRDGRVRNFNFSAAQKASLVAFLKTLSDTHFITDPKFSDPFQ